MPGSRVGGLWRLLFAFPVVAGLRPSGICRDAA